MKLDVHTVFEWYCFAVPFIALAVVLWGVEAHEEATKGLVQIEQPGEEYTLQAILEGLKNEQK